MKEKYFLYHIKDIEFFYSIGSQKIKALTHLSLDIPKGCLVTFSGPSGSGKSTLLNLLGLIEPVQKGIVYFNGENISKISDKRKNQIRKTSIGFIFLTGPLRVRGRRG